MNHHQNYDNTRTRELYILVLLLRTSSLEYPLDTLTHIVLGACIGEATAGRALGKKAMGLGVLAHSLPDIDFITHFWLDTTDGLLAHRGFTHSILFGVLATIVLAVVSQRLFPHRPFSRTRWLLLFSINIFSHNFLDTFNAYGTGWFEPFWNARISFNIIYVADPIFSVFPFVAFVFLLLLNMEHKRRKIAWMGGLGLCALYLCYAIFNKATIDSDVRYNLRKKGIEHSPATYITTPSPFNVWLWFVVAADDSGYHVGYRSVFDSKREIDFHYFPRNDSLLGQVSNKDEVKDLLRFSGKFYTVEKWNDTLVFNVLRFGQVVGWYDPAEKFTFYFYLDRPGANDLVVQRGRFERWNKETFTAFVRRILGN